MILLLSGCYLLTPADLAARLAQSDSGAVDTAVRDTAGDSTSDSSDTDTATDTGTDTGEDTAPPGCDVDADGALDVACGGDDCDDDNAAVNPGATERCNDIDDDCDGKVDGVAVPDDAGDLVSALAVAGEGELICLAAGAHAGGIRITQGEIIEGAGEGVTTIAPIGLSNAVIVTGPVATLRDLTISGGWADEGAGLFVTGDGVTLERVQISGNDCVSEEVCRGVGASLRGAVTLEDVTFASNTATLLPSSVYSLPTVVGGGVYVNEATGVWRNVRAESNTATNNADSCSILGIGVWVSSSTLDVAGLVSTGNSASSTVPGDLSADGAGLAVYDDASTYADVELSDNRLALDGFLAGGGLYVQQAAPSFTRLVVRDNALTGSAPSGAGVYVYGGSADFENLQVLSNETAAGSGEAAGAFVAVAGAEVSLRHADVVGNLHSGASIQGAGLHVGALSRVTVESSAWIDNEFVDADSITTVGYGSAIYVGTGGEVSVRYSNFFYNEEPAFYGMDDPRDDGSGNLGVDPGYTMVAGDTSIWDLRLAPGSAMIDAGDIDAKDVDGSRADMGSHGGEQATW